MSNIEVILGLACVILIWIAHAIHKRAKEDEKSAKSRIDYLSQERDKYATEAGYKLSLDLKYEQNKHIYEVAEERYAQLQKKQKDGLKELGKVNVEITNARVKLFEAEEELKSKKKRLEQLSISVAEKQEELYALHKASKASEAEAEEELKSKNKAIIKAEIAAYIEESERLQNKIEEQNNVLNNIQAEILKKVEDAKQNIMLEPDADVINAKIARAWADYKMIIWERAVDSLLRKPHPISFAKAREYERQIADFKERILVEYKNIEYQYNYLLAMFPELQEYIDGEAVQELSSEVPEELDDKRQYYIPKEEWETLNESQKSQIALDRYNERRRLTNSQVGRDYEEYIAFLFRNRCKGAVIDMYGEQKGLADLGRDLIVKHSGKVYIVQCKRWSQDRVIREKHIMQLFGTTIEYCWEMKKKDIHPLDVIGKSVIPVFVTTTELSPTANRFAERLGVIVYKVPMGDYPQIKCNIGKEGERIYHLPFDQQYNTTIIEHNKGEFMAWTVQEAEDRGFRHAMRHYI